MIVGVALLALLAGYFSYGYSQIRYLQKPDTLIAFVASLLDKGVPQARNAIETQVKANASVWTEHLSQQLVAAAPMLRKAVEDYALRQTDVLVDHLTVMGEKEFRNVLDENRDDIQEAFKQMGKGQASSEKVLGVLDDALERELQVNMERQAKDLLDSLIGLNERLKKLSSGRDLTPEDKIERQVLMITRRLQKEQLEQERAESPSVSPTTEAAQPASEETTEPASEPATEPEVGNGGKPNDKEAHESKEQGSSPSGDQKTGEPETPDNETADSSA